MVIKLEDIVCGHGTIRELGKWPDTNQQLYLCMDCDSSITDNGRNDYFSIGNYSPACYLHDKDAEGKLILRWVYQKKQGS